MEPFLAEHILDRITLSPKTTNENQRKASEPNSEGEKDRRRTYGDKQEGP
jgi:hypothetical protein